MTIAGSSFWSGATSLNPAIGHGLEYALAVFERDLPQDPADRSDDR
jgi:hypothetical protein